jgi:hypothetical protein
LELIAVFCGAHVDIQCKVVIVDRIVTSLQSY